MERFETTSNRVALMRREVNNELLPELLVKNNQGTSFYIVSPDMSETDEELDLIEAISSPINEKMSITQYMEELNEELASMMDVDGQSTLSLNGQLSDDIKETNLNTVLKNSSETQKDKMIRTLVNEIEKRDKMLELCSSSNSLNTGFGQWKRPDKKGIIMESVSDVLRKFTIWNKQEQNAFRIKTETVRSAIDILNNFEDTQYIGNSVQGLNGEKIKKSADSELPEVKYEPKELINLQSITEIVESRPKCTQVSLALPKKRSFSQSEDILENIPHEKKLKIEQENDEVRVKIEKDNSEVGVKVEKSRNSKRPDTSTSIITESTSANKPLLPLPKKVLDIPKLYRRNFGTSDESDLDECSHAMKFWFDEEHKDCTKFFIRLHDDSTVGWQTSKLFMVKEQVGLNVPITLRLKFPDLLRRLEKTSNKRIWLSLRDFNIFSKSAQDLFGPAIENSITHFSFGYRLYGKDELNANLLLEFIFKHLTQLEFCSINNGMLKKMDSLEDPRTMWKLWELKTLRLIHSKTKFSTPFISKMLRMSPKLDNLYGLPLHCLREFEELERDESGRTNIDRVRLCSVYIRRDCYQHGEKNAEAFLADLTTLESMPGNTLEEFDTRTFFMDCSMGTRARCVQMISKIIKKHEKSLKVVKVEPCGNEKLIIPPLKNLETIRYTLSKPMKKLLFSPSQMDIYRDFQGLKTVEMNLERRPFTRDLFKDIFPRTMFRPRDSFARVKKLVLRNFCPCHCLSKITELFKNITILHLRDTLAQISAILPIIYSFFPQLQQLILEVDTNGQLDSAITGFDKDVCKALRKTRALTEGEATNLISIHGNKKPSIIRLRDLHLLHICIRSENVTKNDKQAIFSPISVFCGFGKSRMPNLNVLVTFDERVSVESRQRIASSLSPVKDYIYLEH